MNKFYRVGAVSCPAKVNDNATNLATLAEWTEKAAAAGVRLLLFPELNLTGYTTAGLVQPLDETSPAYQEVARIAARYDVIIAAGMAWRNENDKVYLAHGLWLPSGKCHRYYKTHLGSREAAAFAAGDDLPVFEIPGIRVGLQMCLEQHFPDIAQTLALRGAQLILCPHATPRISAGQRRESWHISLRARAYDNCVYLLACNQAGDNGLGLTYPGGALLVDPSGRVLAEDFSGEPALITGDIDLTQVLDVRTTPQGMCRRFYAPSRRKELYE